MRLIDADAVEKAIRKRVYAVEVEDILSEIGNAPSIDVVFCKECKHRVVNEHYGEEGYLAIKAMCDLDTGDIFELGRWAENDEWFCADGERRG